MLENRVLRKTFETVREEGTQSLRKMYSAEIQELCFRSCAAGVVLQELCCRSCAAGVVLQELCFRSCAAGVVLQELCSSPDILIVNKSRRMGWEGNVARRGYKRNVYNFDGKPEERDLLEDLRVDGRLILNWILKEMIGRMWTEVM